MAPSARPHHAPHSRHIIGRPSPRKSHGRDPGTSTGDHRRTRPDCECRRAPNVKEDNMPDKRIALVTGANQGVGLQVAKELVTNGVTVLVGSRNCERGEAAAREIGAGAIALQLDVTDRVSIAAAAERIRKEFGRLDLLIQNAAISNTRKGNLSLQEYAQISRASNASLDEVRTVWETNVFGVLAVYQAMLPLLRESSDARIINVSSAVGSLTSNADPGYPYHPMFGPVYPASKEI